MYSLMILSFIIFEYVSSPFSYFCHKDQEIKSTACKHLSSNGALISWSKLISCVLFSMLSEKSSLSFWLVFLREAMNFISSDLFIMPSVYNRFIKDTTIFEYKSFGLPGNKTSYRKQQNERGENTPPVLL